MTRGKTLPWLALALLFGVPGAWLLHDRRGLQEAFPAGSVHGTSENGTSLAFAYLSQRERQAGRGPVRILQGDLAHASLDANAVLFRVQPPAPTWLHWLDGQHDPADETPVRPPGRPHARPPAGSGGHATGATGARPGETRLPPGDAGDPDGSNGPSMDSRDVAAILDDASLRFVHGGGRLVLALAEPHGGFDVSEAEGSGDPQRVHPLWIGVDSLEPPVARVLEGPALRAAHAIFAVNQRPVIARLPLGRGEIVVLACPEILENGALEKADHLALLERLVGVGRPVWFDEHVHGAEARAGVMMLLREARLGPFLVVAMLAALAGAWRAGTRVGPPEDPHRERRSEAVDYVDSVARLYERSLRRRDALDLYTRGLVHDVALREGLRGERLEARVRELTDGLEVVADARRDLGSDATRNVRDGATRDVDPREFGRMLNRLNEAYGRLEGASRRRTPRIPDRPA